MPDMRIHLYDFFIRFPENPAFGQEVLKIKAVHDIMQSIRMGKRDHFLSEQGVTSFREDIKRRTGK